MKTRFNTLDVTAAVNDLKQLEGARIVNVYDVDHKTYIMKVTSGKEKAFILMESGIRIHRVYEDCEKAPFPSNFSVKLRKHLNNRRIYMISQVGMDRIVDLQIDQGARCCHVIVELYDRGNIILTNSSYTILNILRPRTEKDTDVKLVVKERYVVPNPRTSSSLPSKDDIVLILTECDQKLPLKRAVIPTNLYGAALIEHVLLVEGLDPDLQVGTYEDKIRCASTVVDALRNAAIITRKIQNSCSFGFVPYKLESRSDGKLVEILLECHPYLFTQHERGFYKKFESFSKAVDAFYSMQYAQKLQEDALKVERETMKRLDNVKNDQLRRLVQLQGSRDLSLKMADLIVLNQALVDSAVNIISKALAQKVSWSQIVEMHRNAVENGDPVAKCIVRLNLECNQIVIRLTDDESNSWDVPIDVGMNAFANSCELYINMKSASDKMLRTKAAAEKAIKNAEAKTRDTIKQIHVRTDAVKARKEFWFEKFLWFISSEKYLVIGGRDANQNELLVKRYLRSGDIYVHADTHGAASVIIRNEKKGVPVPLRTLTESAQMAICYSASWTTQIVPGAWWVYAHQVSKTAPSGEYLSHGSFMIRGKKNLLPGCPLQLGFGILFRVDEDTFNIRRQISMLRVPTTGGCDESLSEEYTIVDSNVKGRHKQSTKDKDKETQQYLEKKLEEERKAATARKGRNVQKHKMDKIRKKYRDQDDDEREMRLAIIGCRGMNKNDAPSNINKPSIIDQELNISVAREAKDREDAAASTSASDVTLTMENSSCADVDENITNGNGSEVVPPDLSAQMESFHLNNDQTEEQHPILDDDDQSAMALTEGIEDLISRLVSKPFHQDMLLYAVPMVGPYQALGKFKYKVKITPGTCKKNKAGKSSIDLFLRLQDSNPQERALIRALSGDENSFRNIPKGSRVLAQHLHAK